MSVDFYPATVADGVTRPLRRCTCDEIDVATALEDLAPLECRACQTRLNLHDRRADDLLTAVGLHEPYGALPAATVVERCEAYLRRLAPEPARPGYERGRLVVGGAPAGDTRDTVARLLEVARDALAAGGWVAWS